MKIIQKDRPQIVARWVQDRLTRYEDKSKRPAWFEAFGVQFPETRAKPQGVKPMILNETDIVKFAQSRGQSNKRSSVEGVVTVCLELSLQQHWLKRRQVVEPANSHLKSDSVNESIRLAPVLSTSPHVFWA